MSDSASISVVNMSLFRDEITDFAKSINHSVAEVAELVMGWHVNDVVRSTPPFSTTQQRTMQGLPSVQAADKKPTDNNDSLSARQVGQARVEADIHKVMEPLPENWKAWEGKGGDTGFMFFTSSTQKGPWKVRLDRFKPSPSLGDLKNHHNMYRNRNGRIGKVRDQLYMARSRYQDYLNREKQAVGALKAGWMKAVERYSGKKFASWITNNPRPARGYTGGQIDKNGNGTLTATNDCPYADTPVMVEAAEHSARVRQSDFEKWAKVRAEKIIEQIDKKAGRAA